MELLEGANFGYLDRVITLIQQGVHVNTKNRRNQTALYFACEKGHTGVVQYLLESGASVSLGAEPLTVAVRNGHYECCKLLLEHHASVHCTNSEGESPLSVAVRKHHYSIILLLVQHGATPSASLNDIALQLLKRAKAEHVKAVQILIDQHFINLTSESIFLVAFGFAFKHGLMELVDRMLSNAPTVGHTPLYAACKEGHETVAMLLLNNGADPNVRNKFRVFASNDFFFPLQAAVQRGNVAICDMLLQKGAKLDQPGEPLVHIESSYTISY